MRSAMSVPPRLGTWQQAQAVWKPAGARDGSKSLGCDRRTKGRSECSFLQELRSERVISARVPPRWTVPARAHWGALQGIGARSAQSILKTPGPYLYRFRARV